MRLITLLITLIISSTAFSQSLEGLWESNDEDGHCKYIGFMHDEKFNVCLYYINDGNEAYSLDISDFENLDQTTIEEHLILYDFIENGDHWSGTLIYDEDGSTMNCDLELTKDGQMKLTATYMYVFTEEFYWNRIHE